MAENDSATNTVAINSTLHTMHATVFWLLLLLCLISIYFICEWMGATIGMTKLGMQRQPQLHLNYLAIHLSVMLQVWCSKAYILTNEPV